MFYLTYKRPIQTNDTLTRGFGNFMKNTLKLLIAGITLTSTVALAQFDTQEIEMARTVAQLASVDHVIKSIKLNESGVMIVALHDGNTQTMKLSAINSQTLLAEARALAEVEVTTENRTVVCKMALNPRSIQNLSIINLENNKLRLVLTTNNCAMGSVTYPVNEHSLEMAKNFRTQLVVLARQLVNSDSNMQINVGIN